MSSRVSKSKAKPRPRSTAFRDSLLRILDLSAVEMPSCANCASRDLTDCRASPVDSSRCVACVRSGLPGCDVSGPSPAQLGSVGQSFSRLRARRKEAEDAVDKARAAADKAFAAARRLRRQEELLAERVYRMFQRGLQSLEELESVEEEERRQASKATPALLPESRTPTLEASSVVDPTAFDWAADFVLDPSLLVLVDPGVAGDTGEPSPRSPQGAC
jgi:hypothetical protein